MHLKVFRAIVSDAPINQFGMLATYGPYEGKHVLKSEVANRSGCYGIYDNQFRLRYVGRSAVGIAARSYTHFASNTQASSFWTASPAFAIDLVPIENPKLANDLERYLTIESAYLRALTWSNES